MSGGLPINLPLVGSSGSAALQSLGALGASRTLTFPTTGNIAYDGTLSVTFTPVIVASAASLYGEMVIYVHQPAGTTLGITLPSNVMGLPSGGISIPSGNIARIVLACEAGLVFFVSATNFVAQVATTVGTFTVGFNWSGMETNGGALPGIAGTDYAILTDAEMAYYSAKGLLLNRLPILWQRIQPTLGGALDTGYLGHITDALTLAAKYGARFIVDLHNYGSYGSSVLGGGSLTNAQFADVWTKLATALAGHAGLAGYDIMNEPHDLGPAGSSIATQDGIWVAAAQAAITGIGTVDTVTDIYVENIDYSDAFLWESNGPTLHTLTSSGNRIIYEAHSYLDRDSSGTNFIWATEVAAGDVLTSPVSTLDANIGVKRINPFIAWCLAHGKIGFLGEVGVGRDVTAWNDALRNTMTRAQAAGLGMTYWCGGSGYASYPEGITPDSAGNDTAQMAVLCEFTGIADAPTRYTVTGPNRGAVSAASTAFPVLVKGRIATAFTIIPASSVSGVTFTPASLSVPVGDNFAGSFVINAPATSAAIAVSFTNTGGLSNPTTIGYSTITDLFVGLGAEPTNVWWPTLLYTPYVGSAMRLQRSSDSAQLDVGFTSAGILDLATAATWYGSATPSGVNSYDQGPGARHMVPVFSDNTSGPVVNGQPTALATSAADYPTFVPNAYNGLPALRFAKSRMDAHSPLDGSTAITVFLAVKPTSVANAIYMMSWDFVQRFVLCGDSSGDWEMSGETTTDMSLNVDPTVARVYAVTWGGGGSRTVWRDGSIIATSAATETSLAFQYRDAVNFGYFRFYPTFAAFDLIGAIVLPVVPTAAQMAAFFNRLCGDLAIPQIGIPGALTLTSSSTTTLVVSVASLPANATSLVYQYSLAGKSAWTTAATVAATTANLSYGFTGLTGNTNYDIQVLGTSGSYIGKAAQLLAQMTLPAAAGTGPVIRKLGVNLSGGDFSSATYVANSNIAAYGTAGLGIFRIAFEMCRAFDNSVTSTTPDPAVVSAIGGNVAYARSLGYEVVLDDHTYGSYNGTEIGTSGYTYAQWGAHWAAFVTAILPNGDDAGVHFGLNNEPRSNSGNQAGADWIAGCNTAAQAIRAAGYKLGSMLYTSYGNSSNGPADYILGATDSLRVCEFHNYFDSDSSGRYALTEGAEYRPIRFLTYTLEWGRINNFPMFMGESGYDSGTVSIETLTSLLGLCQRYGIWGITLFGATNFGSSYVYWIPPPASGTANCVQIVEMQQFMSGGGQYGQTPILYPTPLPTDSTCTYSTTTGLTTTVGGATTSSTSSASSSVFTFRGLFTGSSATTGQFFGVSGTGPSVYVLNGVLCGFYKGPNSNINITTTIAPSAYMDIGFSQDASGCQLIINGVLAGSNTALLNANLNFPVFIGGDKGKSFLANGTTLKFSVTKAKQSVGDAFPVPPDRNIYSYNDFTSSTPLITLA